MNRAQSRESDEENVPSGSDSPSQEDFDAYAEVQRTSAEHSEAPTAEFEDSESVEDSQKTSTEPSEKAESFRSETISLPSEEGEEKKDEESMMRHRDFIIQMPCNRIWYPPPWLNAERLFRNPLQFRVAVSKKMTLLGEQHSNVSYYSQSASSSNKSKTPDSSTKNNQSTTAFRHPKSKSRMGGGIGGGMGGGIGGGIGGGMGKLGGDGDSFHEPPPGLARPANQNRTFYY
ncbi:unnamed protein product, partial [Mesorhabditis belari]|uniref:Uncharacterized protein n=1 Tax=Mesorhabditis belari TaxID=2138241 RepID=A0AAF3FGJ9_9BILA